MGMIGSASRFGIFTITGDFGLGVDLNKEERCYAETARGSGVSRDAAGAPTGSGCGQLEIVDTIGPGGGTIYPVSDFLYPAVLEFRLALGISID